MTSARNQAAAADERAHDLAAVPAEIGTDLPLRDIADKLTARCIPTPRGGRWHAATVARLLARMPAKVSWRQGDALTVLRTLPADHYDCCVTSPPYYFVRDYGHHDQIGMEVSPTEYVAKLVSVFREVRRTLRPTGSLWLVVADNYCTRRAIREDGKRSVARGGKMRTWAESSKDGRTITGTQFKHLRIKEKDLFLTPFELAKALRFDGWYLRSTIIWAKPTVVPERPAKRPTQSHEYVFLLTKAESGYIYNDDVLRERSANGSSRPGRTVWTIAPDTGNRTAHTATMPYELASRCVRVGSNRGGLVLDPFGGGGTTGRAARMNGRNCDLIDLMPIGGPT